MANRARYLDYFAAHRDVEALGIARATREARVQLQEVLKRVRRCLKSSVLPAVRGGAGERAGVYRQTRLNVDTVVGTSAHSFVTYSNDLVLIGTSLSNAFVRTRTYIPGYTSQDSDFKVCANRTTNRSLLHTSLWMQPTQRIHSPCTRKSGFWARGKPPVRWVNRPATAKRQKNNPLLLDPLSKLGRLLRDEYL